jgi:hypothetical protein
MTDCCLWERSVTDLVAEIPDILYEQLLIFMKINDVLQRRMWREGERRMKGEKFVENEKNFC